MPFPISAQSASSPSLLPSRKRRRGLRFACAVMVAGTLALSACTDGNKGANENAASSAQGKQKSHFLAVDAPTVINAPDPLGLVAAEKFFSSKQERKAEMTELVVLSGDSASLPAAQYAIAAGVPVMSLPADATVVSPTADGSDQGWLAEVKRFVEERGIEKLSTFNLTAEQKETLAGIDGVDEVAEPGEGSEAQTVVDEPASLAVLEDIAAIESPRDGEDGAPVILVAAGTSAAQVATARAAGLSVEVLPAADPRATSESMTAVANNNVVAVGSGFGNQELFDRQVQLASNGELPGGGGLVFPGRRMVALYGHPSGPALGVMGEQGPAEAVAVAKDWAAQYQELTQWPVIPAFEVIATVASSGPGDDGDYSNETDPAELKPYVDAIVNAGGYAVLDLQPGRARLLDQAKIYEDLMKHPNVGLALDPEWKIGPDEVPMTNIGHVNADEVNEVANWLAQLVADNNLPQKALVLHQFQLQMLRDRELIKTDYPELAFVLHADGHGDSGQKMETWNALRQDLSPDYFMAWKNFIDEDTPMFDPAQTYAVDPRPWFVSYQ